MIVILTQCFPPAIGGIEHLMGGAARALAARHHDVRVLADGDASPEQEYGDVRYFSGLKLVRNFRKIMALRELVGKQGAKALLADSWKSLETLLRANCAARVERVVCFAHGNEFPEKASTRKAARIRESLALAHLIIANSKFTADRVRQFVNDSRIVVWAPAIDDVAAIDSCDRDWVEGLWGDGGPRLMSLSRLERLKGIDQVISVIRLLLPDYPGLRYVVAGAGDDLVRLQRLVVDNEVGDHVFFAGAVHGGRKSALYASADVFLMPTRRVGAREEAFGMVYLEAALHGLPVVGGLAGGASEAVIDGKTGLLVDGTDRLAIAAAIRQILANPQRRAVMSDSATRFASDFTWRAQISRLESYLGLSATSRGSA